MSNTPRTDAWKWSSSKDPVDEFVLFAQQLELELQSAQTRIKHLLESGDKLYSAIYCGCLMDGPCKTCSDAADLWDEIKEAKP